MCVVLGAGCTFDARYGVTAACDDAHPDCPTGLRCSFVVGRCVANDDRDAPVVSGLRVQPAAGAAGTRFVVSFEVSRPLAWPPRVRGIFSSESEVAFTPVDGGTTAFEYVAAAGGPAGLAFVTVDQLVDEAGNTTSSREQASFFIDAAPPVASEATLRLTAADGLPTRLGPNGRGELAFSFDEPVGPDVALTAEPDVVDFTRLPRDAGVAFALSARPSDGGFTGEVRVTVRASDLVGNRGAAALVVSPPLVVDDEPAPVSATRWHRTPDGTAADPAPRSTFTATTEAGIAVRLLDAAGIVVASAQADADGGVRIVVPPPDRRAVDVTALDQASNVTPRREVERVVLTAQPASALSVGAAGARLFRPDGIPADATRLLAGDGVALGASGSLSVRALPGSATAAGAGCALATHESLRTVIGYVAAPNAPAFVQRTGDGWVQWSAAPGQRVFASLAYDRTAARLVLFGGDDTNDVWEWDESVWTQVPSSPGDPSPRNGGVLVTAPRGTLLIGGADRTDGGVLRDVWLRERQRWCALDAGVLGAFTAATAAYDLRRDRTWILASTADAGARTFWFDGAELQLVADAGPATAAGGLSVDPSTGLLHLLARRSSSSQAWTFDGGRWEDAGLVGAGQCVGPGAAWHPSEGELWCCTAAGTLRFHPRSGDAGVVSTAVGGQPGKDTGSVVVTFAASGAGTGWLQVNGTGAYAAYDRLWQVTPDAGWFAVDGGWLPRKVTTLVSVSDGGLYAVWGQSFDAGPPAVYQRQSDVYRWSGAAWTLVADGGAPAPPPSWQDYVYAQLPFVEAYGKSLYLGDGRADAGVWQLDDTGWSLVSARPTPYTTPKYGALLLQRPGATSFGLFGGNGAETLQYAGDVGAGGEVSWRAGPLHPRLDRTGASASWDPQRRLHFVFGGLRRDSQPVDDFLDVTLVEADAGALVDVLELSDAEGDGSPRRRYGSALWWSAAENGHRLSMGSLSVDGDARDHWLVERSVHRPALLAVVPLGAARLERPLRRLTVRARLGGLGVAPADAAALVAAPLAGARLLGWQRGAWVELARVASPPDAPGLVEWDAVDLARTAYEAPGEALVFAAEPLGVNGPGRAAVALDQLTVELEQ